MGQLYQTHSREVLYISWNIPGGDLKKLMYFVKSSIQHENACVLDESHLSILSADDGPPLDGKILFKKPAKRSSSDKFQGITASSSKKKKSEGGEKEEKKEVTSAKKVKNNSLLSFGGDEEQEED